MIRYIKFVEENVDGCGSDVDVVIAIESDLCLTPAYTAALKKAISEIKKEWAEDEWDTDAIVGEAMSRVFGDAKYTLVFPDICVYF